MMVWGWNEFIYGVFTIIYIFLWFSLTFMNMQILLNMQIRSFAYLTLENSSVSKL